MLDIFYLVAKASQKLKTPKVSADYYLRDKRAM